MELSGPCEHLTVGDPEHRGSGGLRLPFPEINGAPSLGAGQPVQKG